MSFLLVDKVTRHMPSKLIEGVKHVSCSEPYLTFSQRTQQTVFIPSLVGEAIGQLAAWSVMNELNFCKRPVAGIVSKVDIFDEVKVGETIKLQACIDTLDDEAVQYHGVAFVEQKKVFEIESAVGPMVPMDEMINVAAVKQQYQQITKNLDANKDIFSEPTEYQNLPFPGLEFPKQINPSASFDRLLTLERDGLSIAEKIVSQSAPYFSDHFPLKPVLPLTILLNCKIELAQLYLKEFYNEANYQVRCAQKIKMSQFVSPGNIIRTTMQAVAKGATISFKFKSYVDEQRVCLCEIIFDLV